MKNNTLEKIYTGILYGIIFFACLFNPFDPDLGWELKYGQYFFQHHQVLKTNIFSTIMSNFYWVNHGWGFDAITYLLYHFFGFFGLTIATSILATITFYFFDKASKFSFFQRIVCLLLLLYLTYPLFIGGWSTQFISLFFLSILLYLLRNFERGSSKYIYFTIPLFWIWANVSGEFLLGIGTLLLWIGGHSIKTYHTENAKKLFIQSGIAFIFALVAVLINPFGVDIYTEAFKHFSNPNLQFIVQWQPLVFFSQDWWNIVIVGIVFLYLIKYLYTKHQIKENLPLLLTAIVFLIFSIFSRRYVWPFYILGLALFTPLIDRLQLEKNKKISYITLIILGLLALFIGIKKIPLSQYMRMSWDIYCQQRLCSPKAAQYLINHHLNTNPHLLTQYDLGGWLIWNYYPQIKPTLDGRMTLWIDNNGYNPFLNYISLEYNFRDIDQSGYTVVFTSIDKPFIKRFVQLMNEGKWSLVYYDHKVAIFVKKV